MTSYRLLRDAETRVDEIFDYTYGRWGEEQATRYFQGLIGRFAAIAARKLPWRQIPASYGVDGYYCSYEYHLIYWRELADGSVGIVTVLHERMSQPRLVREAFND